MSDRSTMTCDKVQTCNKAGRYSMCYKEGMEICQFFSGPEKIMQCSNPDCADKHVYTVGKYKPVPPRKCGTCGSRILQIDGPCEELASPPVGLKKLINDHWSYVENLLKNHGTSDKEITLAEFHYKTAFEHGYKHRDEELR